MTEKRKKLVLIDGHSILNRAFYGMPDLTNAKGQHTGAVLGFLNILFKILDEEQADYLTVAFDVHAPTFRHEAYEAYKGTRKSMPEELREQVPLMKEVLGAMGISTCEKAGLEADDILGTLAKRAEAEGMDVSLVSGDRDLLQIATDRICIRIPRTRQGQTTVDDFYAGDVLREYGVTPVQFIDVKALMGDTSDNIPGVPKVGEKTATQLIREYGSVDGVYANLDKIRCRQLLDVVMSFCDVVSSHEPQLAEAYTQKSIGYFWMGENEEALDALTKGLKKVNTDKDKAMLYNLRGDYYHTLGERQKMYADYDSTLIYDPDNINVLNNYAYYLSVEGRDLKKALAMSAKTLEAEPLNSTYLDTYAWILFKMKKYKEALGYMEKAMRYLDRDNPEVYEHYGDVLFMCGEKEKALENWHKALQANSTSATLDQKIKQQKYLE